MGVVKPIVEIVETVPIVIFRTNGAYAFLFSQTVIMLHSDNESTSPHPRPVCSPPSPNVNWECPEAEAEAEAESRKIQARSYKR